MRELSPAAREHFEHPRHVGCLDSQQPDIAAAHIESPIGGEILQLHLRIDAQGIISAVRFKAYGCGWMIACGSLLAETILRQPSAKAARFRHHELVERLTVPPEKLHCAVLAETVLQAVLHNNAATWNFIPPPVSSSKEPRTPSFPKGAYEHGDYPD